MNSKLPRGQILIVWTAILIYSFVSAGCTDGSDSPRHSHLVVSLADYSAKPKQTVGAILTIRGVAERVGNMYRVSDLDPDFHNMNTLGINIWVVDEALLSAFNPENDDHSATCLGVPIEISGRVGKTSHEGEFGLVNVETIFLLDSQNYDTGRGPLCYSNLSNSE